MTIESAFPGKRRLRAPKRQQSVLESAARDRNWLLGRLAAAERVYNKAIWDALEYADTGYRETCRKHHLQINQSKVYAYQRAASSMVRDARAGVNAHFESTRRVELSKREYVEPVHDFSTTEPTKP